jgi:maleylpyruvate isomerase
MSESAAELQALRASTTDLLQDLGRHHWSAADVAAPSLCTGWTRGHVLTHLARNADGVAATLEGALAGAVVERYPDGWAARNAAIDAGSRRPFAELVADVRDSAARLDRTFAAVVDADGWGRVTEKGHPASHWPMARWKEVEIHRLDLAAGYSPDRWPPALVAALFEPVVGTLPDRVRQAVHVTVTPDRSLLTEFSGREWAAGEGNPVEVAGPDWAVLAWLVGRPSTAAEALTATPELGPYN